MKRLLGALSCAGMVFFGGAAKADLLQNGSFEVGEAIGTQGFETVKGLDFKSIAGWVVRGSVDYIGSYWKASDQDRSLDLSGNSNGSVAQTFATTKGQQYLVTFDVAGNPDGGPKTKTGSVDVGIFGGVMQSENLSFTNDASTTRGAMGWQKQTFAFTADSSATTLTFASTTDTSYGIALDNVAVSAVPLPASLQLFAAAVLAMGGFAFVKKRKNAALREAF